MKVLKEFGRNPHIDWLAILTITVVIILALATNGFVLYNAVATGKIKSPAPKKPVAAVKIDEKALQKVYDKFVERDTAFKKIETGYTAPADPSI